MYTPEKTVVLLRPDQASLMHINSYQRRSKERDTARNVRAVTDRLARMVKEIGNSIGTRTKMRSIQLFRETEEERTAFLGAQRARPLATSDVVLSVNPTTRQLGALLQGSCEKPQSAIIASMDPEHNAAVEELGSRRLLPVLMKDGKTYGLLRRIFALDLSAALTPAAFDQIRKALLFPGIPYDDFLSADALAQLETPNDSDALSQPEFRQFLVEGKTDDRV